MNKLSDQEKLKWLKRFDIMLIGTTAVIVGLVSILDFLDLIDQVPWLRDRIPTLILLLIGIIAGYLVVERRNYLESIQRNTESELTTLAQNIFDSNVYMPLGIRQNLGETYLKYFNGASKQVDIIALTSENLIEKYRKDILKSKVLSEQCDIRILILDPESELWDYRVRDERGSNRERPKNMIEQAKQFFLEIKDEIQSKDCQGSLTLKYHRHIPYFAYFRADDKMIIGLYYCNNFGVKAHAIEVLSESDVFHSLESHFDAIWHGKNSEEVVYIGYFSDHTLNIS